MNEQEVVALALKGEHQNRMRGISSSILTRANILLQNIFLRSEHSNANVAHLFCQNPNYI